MTTSASTVTGTTPVGDPLRPFVPRLAVDWLRTAPDALAQSFPGTMVFADVSGFTELTERLSRRGRAGSEEIANVLDVAFAELIGAAYAYDADLLKWGGDALLLLFRGDEHTPRAAAAAMRMRRALEEMRRLRTSVGPVRLRLSIGAHAGTFHLCLVGGVHRELVVVGTDATTTVRVEGIADAGEIALSEPTAALLDGTLLGSAKDGTVLLAGEPRLPPIVPPFFDVSGVDLARLLPAEYTHELRGEASEPELRHVAIAFAELRGTDDLLEREGLDAVAAALDERITAIQQTCLRFGATFAQTDISSNGVKAILLTGAPRSAGGDEEELLLRACRAIVETPGRLPVRIGVNAGRVFSGIVGPPTRRTYTFYGDATNTAARIMARAEEGQLLVRDDVLERARTTYALTPVEPFAAKGKAERIRTAAVGRPVGEREQTVGGPFVGRELELGLLLEALGRAREGAGSLVVVTGDGGVGKTRLLAELRAALLGLRGVVVQCEQVDSRPYAAVAAILSRALQLGAHATPAEVEARLRFAVTTRVQELEPWLPLLGAALGLELPPTPETAMLEERFVPDRIAEAVQTFLQALVPETAIVAIDDAHWLDEASNHLIGRVAANLGEVPWLLVVTRRETGTGFRTPEGVEVASIAVEPLSREDSRELVTALTEDAPLPPHVLDGIAERSGGSPLFLTELVSALRAGGAVEDLPGSVEALMAQRVDELPARERAILRHAAVLGGRFELETLRLTLGLDPVEAASVILRLEEFLVTDDEGTVRFRHGLLRQTAYEGLPFRRRRELHERVGLALEHGAGDDGVAEVADRLAHHFYEAADWERARHYGWLAGSHAKSVYANVDAAVQLERALAAARRQRKVRPEEVARIAEALGDVRVSLGEFEGALQAFQGARRRLRGDPVEVARLLYKESYVPYRLGRHRDAQRRLDRGLALLEPVRSVPAMAQRARIEARRAAIEQAQGRLRETIVWCERAIADAETGGAKDALAHGLNVLDSAYVALGQVDRATHGKRALQLFDELGELGHKAGLMNNLGILAYYEGSWAEALAWYRQAQEAWQQAGDRWAASYAALNIGEVLSSQGHLDEAEPLLRDVLRVSQAAGTPSGTATALLELGKLETRRGRLDAAVERLGDARSVFAEIGEESAVIDVDARIAEALVLGGDAGQGAALASAALREADGVEGGSVVAPVLLRVLGLAHLVAGRHETGRETLRRSVAAAEAVQSNYDVAVALDALAGAEREGGGDDAVTARRDELFARLGIVSTPMPAIAS